jgi:hypothetical protein
MYRASSMCGAVQGAAQQGVVLELRAACMHAAGLQQGHGPSADGRSLAGMLQLWIRRCRGIVCGRMCVCSRVSCRLGFVRAEFCCHRFVCGAVHVVCVVCQHLGGSLLSGKHSSSCPAGVQKHARTGFSLVMFEMLRVSEWGL